MSVVNGQVGDQNTFNNAFVSKTQTTGNNVSGKINLQNTDTESGASITNVQKVINQESTSFRVVQTVSASGQIDVDERIKNHIVLVVGDGGDVTTSTTPFNPENGGSFLDGTVITIIGTNQSQKVTIPSTASGADVTVLNGPVELGLNFCITLMRVTIGGTSYWLERSRNQ